MFVIITVFIFCVNVLFAQDNKPHEQPIETREQSINQDVAQRFKTSLSQNPPVAPTETPSFAGEEVPLFGYDFFQNQITAVDQIGAGLVPEDYPLGPGDRIGVYLLGKAQEQFEVLVNGEGKIFVPSVGVLRVLGLTLTELQQKLAAEMARYYSNYSLEVMLLTPKTVRVDVVGEVNAPGRYALSSLHTVIDAILRARGPRHQGSLRCLEIFRNNQLYITVDIYDFFFKRNAHSKQYLQDGDRIYVPLVKSRVAVIGEVSRPAIYELQPTAAEKIVDMIEIAGGFTDYAYLEKIELSRVQATGARIVQYFKYHELLAADSTSAALILKNDDQIRVFSKLDQLNQRYVSIYGAVKRPGEYELEDNMRLSDLILKAGNFTRNAYRLQAEVAKVDPKMPAKIIYVDLKRLLNEHDSSVDLLLDDDDKVFIREIPEWLVGPMVEVRGEVMFPGKYSIVDKETTLKQVLEMAGGVTGEAFLHEAMLFRPGERKTVDKEFERLKNMSREEMTDLEYKYYVMKQNSESNNRVVVDFYNLVVHHKATEDVVLENGDIIQIPKFPNTVEVTGRVGKPGGVIFQENAKLKYYIQKAGDYAWDADKRRTKVIKVTGEVIDDEDVKKFEPGDRIWVPRKQEIKYWEIIRQSILVAAQIAAIFLVIENARN